MDHHPPIPLLSLHLAQIHPIAALPEITALINARYPRHNNGEVPHADYGDIDYHNMDELDTVMKDLVSVIDRLGETFQDALDEYTYEIYKDAKRAGVPLPSHAVEFLNREEKVQDSPLPPNLAKNFLDSPMMREVEDIQLGRWSRKPHWTVDYC